ncbi:hypothetical protein EVAR_43258_1 [Eumeta japonica]|uniref:Uncharacterized protein n=1 Tax=Eumeta variegata TaxID=151549 RepID=A0A4C1WTE1_EUMVA|nr:hypothetical protein EVAR_43258_1 [Eumeta japonica]
MLMTQRLRASADGYNPRRGGRGGRAGVETLIKPPSRHNNINNEGFIYLFIYEPSFSKVYGALVAAPGAARPPVAARPASSFPPRKILSHM